MAFIEKKDPVVLNIKLTSKGREQLSKGQLTFNYFAVGDSEIDYQFNKDAPFNPFYANILRPTDGNVNQLSFITRNLSGDTYNEISAVPCTPTTVENHVPAVGFFEPDANTFLIDSDHVKQPDAMVIISGVTGGTQLALNKAPTYQANVSEPAEGDLLLVRWTNPTSIDTTGYTINQDFPTPYLFYKIQSIVGGSLAADNLIVEVDRDLPDFEGITGGSSTTVASAMIYYNFINYTGDTCYSTDETDDALLAFLQNCQCPTVTFPFWNMSIIFTENIAGTEITDKQYGEFNTVGFGGFVSYIQNQAAVIKKMGLIHYTNNSVANTYAEGFYGDALNPADVTKIPTLDVPTLMYHRSTGNTLGVRLRASGALKYLTGVTKSLNTRYYDLADESGFVVGKVFYDLKIFTIEDQELLFAMSYKSNRSWTLPNYGADLNANVTFGCPDCFLEYTTIGIDTTYVGASDGQIAVTGITNDQGQLILEILSGATGTTNALQVYFNNITGDTIITNADTIDGFQLSAITYTVNLTDMGAPNCTITEEVEISDPITFLSLVGGSSTSSVLNSYFHVPSYQNNPTRIRLVEGNGSIETAGVGFPVGTAYATVGPTGMTNTDLATRFALGAGVSANESLIKWVAIPPTGLDVNALSSYVPPDTGVYAIYVRDGTGATENDRFNSIGAPSTNNPIIDSQVWTYYVSRATPFVADGDIIDVDTSGSDGGGSYVWVSNYFGSIFPGVNDVVGVIEMSVHNEFGIPTIWQPAVNNSGGATKLYYTPNALPGDDVVTIRERFGYIVMHAIQSNGI